MFISILNSLVAQNMKIIEIYFPDSTTSPRSCSQDLVIQRRSPTSEFECSQVQNEFPFSPFIFSWIIMFVQIKRINIIYQYFIQTEEFPELEFWATQKGWIVERLSQLKDCLQINGELCSTWEILKALLPSNKWCNSVTLLVWTTLKINGASLLCNICTVGFLTKKLHHCWIIPILLCLQS